MKRILFSMVCISLASTCFAGADASDKNAQLSQASKDRNAQQIVIPLQLPDNSDAWATETIALVKRITGGDNLLCFMAGEPFCQLEVAALVNTNGCWMNGAVHVLDLSVTDMSKSTATFESTRSTGGILILFGPTGNMFAANLLKDFKITSDPSFPLVFKVVSKKGYVYLCGRGRIELPDGQVLELGRNESVKDWEMKLSADDPLLQEAAVFALYWLGNENSRQPLEVFTAKADGRLKIVASSALAKLRTKPASAKVQSPASPTAAPIPQAVDILKSKSEQGDAAAMYEYSVLLLAGKEVPQNTPEAIRLLIKSAEKGYAKAQNDLGSFYAKGDLGVTKSQDSALRWYKAAAEQNDQEGLYNLGICYEQGEGTPTDMARAAECYEKAAQLGFAKAQYNYGVFLREGRGIPQNVGKAVEWFQKAAAQDDAPALYDLGNCYLKGQGVVSNPTEAVNYFSKAAKLGHKEAQNNLGFCYAKGQGVTQDFSKAIEYWTMAANQGGADACFNLGVCYASGRGTTVNTSEAAKWFRKADSLGHAQAKSALRSIGY